MPSLRQYLSDMLAHARLAVEFATGRRREHLDRDPMFREATIRALEVVGEAAGRTDAHTRADHPEIPWRTIIAMRNRLIHEYGGIDLDVVWDTVRDEIPELIRNLEAALDPRAHPFSGADGLLVRVGNTPLVRIRRVLDGVPPAVEVWAKLEWFNPGGSVKDRAALSMVLDAERSGRLKPGATILDASSGNTGIAYALIAATRGYRLTLCLPKNANAERKRTLRAYGTDIVETDPLEGSDGAIRKAREMVAAQPDRFVYLDQYNNPANPLAHEQTTGPEIWRDTGGRVTHWVTTLGTSGTFMGVSRCLRPRGVRCVSIQPDSPFHGLEGLKHMESSIVPGIYDRTVAHEELGAPTEACYDLVRRLASDEGLLAGVSSGAALWGALQVARRLESGVVVTLFPDGGERYLSEAHVWGPTR